MFLWDDNRNFGFGTDFLQEFARAKIGPPFIDKDNLTYRSHFDNLQFVHAMGSAAGEAPNESSRKIKTYLDTMLGIYQGAQPNMQPDSLVKEISGFNEFFNNSNGHSNTTVRSLFMGTTPSYNSPDIRLRALGSALHVIQDSFAKGHCLRDNNGTGLILNFHCYKGQDSDDHGHFDSEGGDDLKPWDLDSFKGIYGGLAAIGRCIEFLELATRSGSWRSDMWESWFAETFRLHPNATGSDTSV